MKATTSDQARRPIRVGVFGSPQQANAAFDALSGAGFSDAELTVFCSQESHQRQFPESVARTGDGVPDTAAAGGASRGLLGGVSAAAGLATVAGVPVVVAGALSGTLTGGDVGGLAGAMMERGVEKEPADFFDQAVSDGKILVSVEPEDHSPGRLNIAEELLSRAGAEPLPLEEG